MIETPALLNPELLPVAFLIVKQLSATLERLIRDRKTKGAARASRSIELNRNAAVSMAVSTVPDDLSLPSLAIQQQIAADAAAMESTVL